MFDPRRGYQHDFAENHAEMYSDEGRVRKANTTRLILAEAFSDRLARAEVLNVGCSTGIIDAELAPSVGSLTGIDIDASAIRFAQQSHNAPNLTFQVGDAMNIDAPDASFDIVLCAQVYEHVPDPMRLMSEIERVLKPGGACYFAATNRLNPIEQHYKLPLLSVVPVSWAHHYLQLLGRGDYYYERHMTHGQLRRLVAQFDVEDITLRVLDDPDRYEAGYLFAGRKLALARFIRRIAYWAFPGYIWLLWKSPGKPALATKR
ncbi:MAG: class I SAM-dependent methyltransferase [Rhodanobacteraceae bacterium]|jgi:2-polyprenyl-3-methyl-5-hydroxy-6-metoxy-1,4-benzoquinol methylase|nr:class I SAM-dependent methyltransferase [Rhodanobacteraceae bacterium]